MDEEKKKSRRGRRIVSRAAWTLVPAVVISAAYLIYMFQWTTSYTDLEVEHQALQLDLEGMESRFRQKVEEHDAFVALAGYGPESEEVEMSIEIEAVVREDLERINRELFLPLPTGDLTLRNVIRELLRRNRTLEGELRAAHADREDQKQRFETERKDLDMQALIYVKQIDRLKKKIDEIQSR
jgi:hypothetical protein